MKTKYTSRSQNDLELLEAIVRHYGKIVTFAQIQAVAGHDVIQRAVRQRLARMGKAGWLIRLKRGLYLVETDISWVMLVSRISSLRGCSKTRRHV